MELKPITDIDLEPIYPGGLIAFAKDFKNDIISSETVTRKYLDRINRLDSHFGAFEYINDEDAIKTAQAMDLLKSSGVYLGPLMGVPIAIKDVFLIDGMPYPKVGSNMELPDILGDEEGTFIKALRSAGCVFLGSTKTVEFCLGITGVSAPRGTPWCSSDWANKRLPGGSSSGSGVAVGADLCMFAIGSDSGGSVRVPAAFNGVFGLKTSFGLWPTDGVFPLDKTVDSIGLLTRSAKEALLIFETLTPRLNPSIDLCPQTKLNLNQIKLGLPSNHFHNGLSTAVQSSFNLANEILTSAEVKFETMNLHGAEERKDYFPVTMPVNLLAILGTERFIANKEIMDPVIATRIESGLKIEAHKYLTLIEKRERSIRTAHNQIRSYDAIVSTTTTCQAPLVSETENPETGLSLALGMTQNTQPANYLDLCAVSLPLPTDDLAMGYQLMAESNKDLHLLHLAVAIEKLFSDNREKFNTQAD